MIPIRGTLPIVAVFLFAPNDGFAQVHPPRSGYFPEVLEDDGEAAKALARIVVPDGFRVELFAAEPHCANLVALDVDAKGRCYLVETFRRDEQVLDIRDHLDWLEDDLACRTVDDRVAMILRRAGDGAGKFRAHSERVRMLWDRDRNGRVETSTVFADGFDGYADGIAAGVLVRKGDVYFADIPNLWRLRDRDGDGVADEREVLSTGYGVHFNFVGHDLHGLRIGPDGRLWFSLGDRGLDVVTKEGRRLQLPDAGAVLRCELDGRELELVHTGLRNPQELAFNDVGDFFTCDNNSDGGDKARLVRIVEGGDSGWQVGWQWVKGSPPSGGEGATPRGAWNAEKMWHPRNAEQPAAIVPCVANLVNGPSGLTHEPGTCFDERWRDHFFVCDFEGEFDNSRVVAFSVEPVGAGYRLKSEVPFVSQGIVATDCDFGPDGAMYVSDWVHGWQQPKRGRVWRITDERTRKTPLAAEARSLLQMDLARCDSATLMQRLGHADQRVRLEAQLALAQRAGQGGIDSLRTLARLSGSKLARLHAIWGLGQVARGGDVRAIAALLPLLRDRDAEVRAQVAKVLGEAAAKVPASARAPAPGGFERVAALEGLTKLLADKEARPAFFAAIALGRFADPSAVAPLVAMLERNDDRDVELRHAGVMGLSGCARDEQLEAVAGASLPSVRMAALLAMRRRGMPQVARFLDDRERALIVEAARAIHDAPIPEGMEELARRLQWNGTVEPPLLARSINANFRLGGREHAQRLAQVASTRSDLPEPVRADALRALVEFDAPPARDRVLGVWRPCANGRSPAAVAVLQPHLGRMLASEGETLRELSARFVATHAVPGFSRELRALVVDSQREVATRAAALEALRATNDPELREVLGMALASESPKLRGAARDVLATIDPSTALPILAKAIEHGTTVEKQDAFATLGAMEYDPASALLCTWLEELTAGDVAPEVALDILEAAERKKSLPQNGQQGELVERLARYEAARSKEDPLAAWKECALGGEPSRGRELFFQRNDLQCLKCHRVGGEGAGESGPDLHGIGAKSPAYLLESIVLPNREIAAGFGNTVFVLKDGDVVDGRAIGETETHWIAVTADRGTVRIRKSAVASRRQGLSAMPADLVQHLSKRDLRDLVAWLGSL